MQAVKNFADVPKRNTSLWREVKKNKFIYLLLLPSVVLVVLFSYMPMWGIRIAFQNYNIYTPEASTWCGFDNFKTLLGMNEYIKAIGNTFLISILNICTTFPATILFALLLNEMRCKSYKRIVQTISYLPHFLSWISVIGIVTTLYSKYGIINDIMVFITGNPERQLFLAESSFFIPNVIILGIWKGVGWGSIVFLAAISGIDTSMYEAAVIDGAGRFKQTIYITLPSILPTITIMLLWKIGAIFSDNFELIYGLQNPYVDFEVIQTLIYKQGIEGGNYQLSTAFGLMQGVVNYSLLFVANLFAKKMTETSIF